MEELVVRNLRDETWDHHVSRSVQRFSAAVGPTRAATRGRVLDIASLGIFGNLCCVSPCSGEPPVSVTYLFFKASIRASLVRSLPLTASLNSPINSSGIVLFGGFGAALPFPAAVGSLTPLTLAPFSERACRGNLGGCIIPKTSLVTEVDAEGSVCQYTVENGSIEVG